VEPFCGGLAVALGLTPARALLNDRNPHLIHFYSWLKRGLAITDPERMSKGAAEIGQGLEVSVQMRNDEQLFYAHRQRFNDFLRNHGADRAEVSALFYYLNRTGFNGLCRFNSRGEFNVPFGDYKTINYVRDFTPYRRVFANWDFMSADFESLPVSSHDFIYADPPYDVPFTQYSREAFGWDEQVRAAEWLSRHEGPVIISNQATKRIVELYEQLDLKLQFLDAPRRISCTGDRTPAKEVLALRNLD
jgi:DNA adenine methylase